MGKIFDISIIISIIILLIYLAVSGYFVYKYVTNKSIEDEIHYHFIIKVLSIIGVVLDISVIIILILVYVLERRSIKNSNLGIRRKSLIFTEDVKTEPMITKVPVIIGSPEAKVFYKFDDFSKYLLDKKYKEASAILDEIIELVKSFNIYHQLAYLEKLLNDYSIIDKLRFIANNELNEKVSRSVLELCNNFENNLKEVLLSLDKLSSVMKSYILE